MAGAGNEERSGGFRECRVNSMDPERWRQIEQLYHAALEKEPGERARFVREACGSDASLLAELESLLAAAGDADEYLSAAVRDEVQRSGIDSPGPDANAGHPVPGKLGRYELLGEIGRGGMGIVYRALDPAIGRTVAIKTILLGSLGAEDSAQMRSRLIRESQAAGQLSHPNIVAVYDVSQEGNTAYIVMEHVIGQTLEQMIAAGSALYSIGEICRIVEGCAEALDYAHSRGVIHRDIKPANVMLQADGAVKITDFGIARSARLSPLTQAAVIVGSPQYMAPEQWMSQAVTGRTDQYALAAVAYTMLTGRCPFPGDSLASLAAQALHEEPPPAAGLNHALPSAVDGVLRKALAKDAARRYETCSRFAAALRAACQNATSTHRWKRPAAAAAVVLAVAAAGGGAWLYQRSTRASASAAKRDLPNRPDSSRPAQSVPVPAPDADPANPAVAKKSEPGSGAHAVVTVKSPPTPVPDPYARAAALVKNGAYAEALPFFTQSLQAAPDYRSYVGRAGAYQHLEQWQEAVDDYTRAIGLNPAGAMAYHERAVCFARLNQDDRALADYSQALDLAPGLALSFNGRGMIYLRRKDYQKANADFTEAIRLRPDLYQAYKNRAATRAALGDISGANADLQQAKALKQ